MAFSCCFLFLKYMGVAYNLCSDNPDKKKSANYYWKMRCLELLLCCSKSCRYNNYKKTDFINKLKITIGYRL